MPHKLVVLGSPGAGKTALVGSLLQSRFREQYEPTQPVPPDGGRSHLAHQRLLVDGQRCRVTIMDTPGSEQHRRLREDCIRWGQGFLLVYAVDCIRSFVNVSLFWDQLQRVRGNSRVPLVLVANKVDKAQRLVTSNTGEEISRSFGVPYVETSAKTGQGVEEAFQELVRESGRPRPGRRGPAARSPAPSSEQVPTPLFTPPSPAP